MRAIEKSGGILTKSRETRRPKGKVGKVGKRRKDEASSVSRCSSYGKDAVRGTLARGSKCSLAPNGTNLLTHQKVFPLIIIMMTQTFILTKFREAIFSRRYKLCLCDYAIVVVV